MINYVNIKVSRVFGNSLLPHSIIYISESLLAVVADYLPIICMLLQFCAGEDVLCVYLTEDRQSKCHVIQGVSLQWLKSCRRDIIQLDDGKSHNNTRSKTRSWRGSDNTKHKKGSIRTG